MEQLSPETLSYLQQFYPGGRNAQQDMQPTQAPDGRWYMPTVVSSGDPHGAGSTQLLGWRRVSGASPTMGEQTNFYNSDGTFSSPGVYKEGTSGKGLFDVLGPLSVLAAPFVWPGMLSAAGFGGSAGAASGAGSAGLGGFNAAVDSQLANAALGSEALAGYTGAAGVTPSLGGVGGAVGGVGASGGGGLLSSIIPKDLMGLAGVVGPAIGGLLGSKPQETSQTSTRSIDPRFADAIFGQGGLLGQVQSNLANRATSGVGQRLMNIPVRGNPFSRG